MSSGVERAASFYADLFGWTYDVSGPEIGHYHVAKVRGAAAAGLGQIPAGADMPSSWTVYLMADDVAAMADDVRARGGSVMQKPFEVPGMGHLAIVQDPAGAVFGLWQPLAHRGAEVAHEPGAMGWCEVNVPDAEAARDFYTGSMGAQARRLEEGVPTTYYVLSKDGEDVGGILQMTEEWAGVPPHWMPYFEVRDADEAASTTEAAGGTVSVPPFDTLYGRITVLNDPFGAVFSVNATGR
ncbi:MAG: VOC family protein [Trueperaceae bacterium]|nr:VOC family protein [Trueperaceae bacterium]